jgi:hypothetical protein
MRLRATNLPRELAGLAATDRRHIDGLVGGHLRGESRPMALLEQLGIGHWRAKTDGDVVRDVIASQGQDGRVPDGPFPDEGHVCRSPPDVDDHHTQLTLILEQHGLRGSQGLQHQILHGEASAVDGADHVLDRRAGARHDMHLDL